MKPETDPPVRIKGWAKGINNIQPDILEDDELRNAVNMDLYDSGKSKRRRGSDKVVSGSGVHSLWSHPDISFGLYVSGGIMYSVPEGLASPSVVVSGLNSAAQVCYQYLHGDVLWSNGIVSGRIRDGANGAWGLETPARTPSLTYTAGGGLDIGTYQVLITYRDAEGEESGSSIAVSLALTSVGSITLGAFPTPVSNEVTKVVVYMTPCNGDVFYKQAVLPINTTSHLITTATQLGTALRTQFLQPMPAGSIIAHLNGAVYVAAGSVVSFSETFRYGLTNPLENHYQFPSDVTIMLSVPEGLYVCADKTYFLTAERQRVLFDFGGVRGTGIYLPNSEDVTWFSPRGQIVGSAGQAKITNERYIPGAATSGASVLRERAGLRQIINVVHQSTANPLVY